MQLTETVKLYLKTEQKSLIVNSMKEYIKPRVITNFYQFYFPL